MVPEPEGKALIGTSVALVTTPSPCFLSGWSCRSSLKASVGVRIGALSQTSESNTGEGSVLGIPAQDRHTAR